MCNLYKDLVSFDITSCLSFVKLVVFVLVNLEGRHVEVVEVRASRLAGILVAMRGSKV